MDKDKRISRLLQQIDQSESSQSIHVDVSRCERLAERRRTTRGVSRTFVAVVMLLACVTVFRPNSTTQTTRHETESPEVASPAVDLNSRDGGRFLPDDSNGDNHAESLLRTAESIGLEAERIERTVELYTSRRRLETLHQRIDELTAEASTTGDLRLREQFHLTAAITLDYAHRLATQADEPLLAAAEYRRVAEGYPNSRWAAIAHRELSQMPLTN